MQLLSFLGEVAYAAGLGLGVLGALVLVAGGLAAAFDLDSIGPDAQRP
ncbi:MAG: hypothetical protein OEY23_11865 [Acidimicrobiia bacterium]|nr:hypothetical protein [Acidimicrobiia bacterium]